MACTSVSMALPLTSATQNKLNPPSSSAPSFRPLPTKPLVLKNSDFKEKSVAALTAAALSASLVLPDMAQAAGNDFSPSLKNFLLSIAAGGVVLIAILGAVIGVSNFDPVKRA